MIITIYLLVSLIYLVMHEDEIQGYDPGHLNPVYFRLFARIVFYMLAPVFILYNCFLKVKAFFLVRKVKKILKRRGINLNDYLKK
jgi:hypothetical protein